MKTNSSIDAAIILFNSLMQMAIQGAVFVVIYFFPFFSYFGGGGWNSPTCALQTIHI